MRSSSAEDHEVRDQRRAAVGDERQRDAGERDHAVTPPMITNVWMPMIVVSPAANSFENGRSAWTAMRKPAPDEQQDRGEHADRPDAARAPRRSRRTRSRWRRSGSLSGCRARGRCPVKPPRPEREHRLHELEALVLRDSATGRARRSRGPARGRRAGTRSPRHRRTARARRRGTRRARSRCRASRRTPRRTAATSRGPSAAP